MHDSAPVATSRIAASTAVRKMPMRAWPVHLRLEFVLPVLAVCIFCWFVSVDMGYAASGGEEVYNKRVQSNAVRQLAFLGLGSVGAYLLLLARPSNAKQQIAWTILLPVAALTSYLFISLAWSDDAVMTFKRSITASLVIVAGLGIGRVWSVRELALGLVVIGCIFIGLSLLAELRFRSFLSVANWRFSGLFHPAKQAFNCGFVLLASLSLFLSSRRKIFLLIAVVVLGLLILTKARTGTAAALVASTWLAWHYINIRGWILIGLVGLGIGSAGMLFYQGTSGRDLAVGKITTMGRDEETADPSKLTGRLPIWALAAEKFTEQPILGYGYGAFWTSDRLDEFERLNGWALFHSHSTYLESLLNVGLIGFALGLLILLLTAHRSVILNRQGLTAAPLISSLLILAFLGGFFEIAFIGLEYESVVMMSAVGAMIFAGSPIKRAAK